MTVAEACRVGESKLSQAGLGSPGTDARLLMAHVLNLPPSTLPLQYREEFPAAAAGRYAVAVARRQTREPLAYITGSTEFMGLRFRCDRRALVPRPDTETLVEVVVEFVGALRVAMPLIADVGTGTGCIGVSLAHLLPHSSVLLTDISEEALALAADNARDNGVEERVRLLCGADLSPILATGPAHAVTVLVSNPPYIPEADIATLEPEVSRHEPVAALDGGPDGLEAYRRLLSQVHELPALRVIAFEVGIGQAKRVGEMMAGRLRGWQVETRPDLAGIPRVVAAHCGALG